MRFLYFSPGVLLCCRNTENLFEKSQVILNTKKKTIQSFRYGARPHHHYNIVSENKSTNALYSLVHELHNFGGILWPIYIATWPRSQLLYFYYLFDRMKTKTEVMSGCVCAYLSARNLANLRKIWIRPGRILLHISGISGRIWKDIY